MVTKFQVAISLTSIFLIITVFLFILVFFVPKSFPQNIPDCPSCPQESCTGYPTCESGRYVIDCYITSCCCERNKTDNSCIRTGSIRHTYRSDDCGYSSDVCADDETITHWNCGCSDGSCYKVEDTSKRNKCGKERETDGGDDPRIPGEVVDYFCSGGSTACFSSGSCKSQTYKDTCSGICGRSELTEYYLVGEKKEKVDYKIYRDLFSKGQYCKGDPGAIYDDKQKPTASLSPQSQNWVNRDISVNIMCDDYDESGCHKYYYTISRIV